MFGFSLKFVWHRQRSLEFTLVRTYQSLSSAPVDDLWKKLMDLTDMSWHPILASTNAPGDW